MNDTQRYTKTNQLELIRTCFGVDEYNTVAADTFCATVQPEQKLFLPFMLAFYRDEGSAEMFQEWHKVRAWLGCIPQIHNWDSMTELGIKIGNLL